MKLTTVLRLYTVKWMLLCALGMGIRWTAWGETVTTTTVQGTVYLANGLPATGTLQLSWPAFNAPGGAAVAAGRTTVPMGADGFFSVNLAPNLGATPAGLFYTAVYHLSDGTTSTEYWVVPEAAQATLAQVRAKVMPAAQAVQAVSKAYVDQAIQSLAQGSLTPVGGTLGGPLYLAGDPVQPLEAADKHYVDMTFAGALPLAGGAATGPLTGLKLGGNWQVDQFAGGDFGAKLQACLASLSSTYGGTCDARNFSGQLAMSANVSINTANATILLPCATISTASQMVVTAGTRNVSLHGCSLRGASSASGSQGGTVFLYSGPASLFQVGDPTYAVDTSGFHLDNAVINTTSSASSTAVGFTAYRTQELDLQSLYFLGNSNQVGMTLDGTGNYTGGTFYDNHLSGYLTAVSGIGHQATNAATTDWLNASTFVRLHINCPTLNGNPVSGTVGVDLAQGDGNTITGGDVEGCGTALHLGPNAVNNTVIGLRNENSINQVVADKGSSYNNWITGGTMFTGELTDNGSRNSFLDSFHRAFNGMNGDWYASTQDGTITNHYRLGTGVGNERGLYDRYQTDYGYRWTTGLSDATAGAQFYQIRDELNNVYRFSIGQYLSATANVVTNVVVNNGGCYSSAAAPTIAFSGGGGTGASATATMLQSTSVSCAGGYTVGSVSMTAGGTGYTSQPTVSFTGSNQTKAPNVVAEITTVGGTNNQTVLNAAGTGAVVLNGSNNSGTGGVVIGSGGPDESTVATISNAGDAQFKGNLQVGGTSTFAGTTTARNGADAEVDQVLWAGLNSNQKESLIYKDNTGASQWYLVKDASNNWGVNSALGGLDSFKAYQSSNSGDTYINTSNSTGAVRINYENGSGSTFNVYGGNGSKLYASFSGVNAIKFPGLAAAGGHDCLQIDNSGFISNTGSPCGAGGGVTGTVNSGTTGQIAYYNVNGSVLSGMNVVPIAAGGTGASTGTAALASLGGASLRTSSMQSFAGPLNAPALTASVNNVLLVTAPPYNAKCDGATDDHAAIQSAFDDAYENGYEVEFPAGRCLTSTITWKGQSFFGAGVSQTTIQGQPGQDVFATPDAPGNLVFGAVVRDMTIEVDNSVNAAAAAVGGNNTFPNRVTGTAGGTTALSSPPAPGPMVFDGGSGNCAGSIASGSTTLTVPCAHFTKSPSFLIVGTPVTVTGVGASGDTLTTTVASVVSDTQLQLAAAAATTSSGATVTVGNGIQAPWYMGNCGIAIPGSDGAAMPSGINGWIFRNLQIEQVNGPGRSNYSCGIFLQAGSYALKFENVDVMNLWGGLVEAPPTKNNTSYYAWTPDTNSYTNLNLKFDLIPLVWYNGAHRVVHGVSIYGGEDPFTLGLFWFKTPLGSTATQYPSGTFVQYYDECWTPNSGEHARFEGPTEITGGNLGQCGGPSYVNWAGDSGNVNAQVGIGLLVSGNANTFEHTGIPANKVTVNGTGNQIEAEDKGSSIISAIAGTPAYRNRPHEALNKLDAGFLLSGNGRSPFTSGSDLLIPCDEFNFAYQTSTTASGCTADPSGTEITQSYAHMDPINYASGFSMSGQANANGSGPYGKYLIVGDRLPRTKMKMLVYGRCGSASCSAQTWRVSDYNGTTNTQIVNASLKFGTDWTTQSVDVDLSTITPGDTIGVNATNLFAGGATYFDLAYIAFQPYNNDAIAETVTSPLTSVATGGSINMNATSWAYGSTSNTGSPDPTSPVGYSTAITNTNSLAQWNGQSIFNAGYDSNSVFPPVPSTIAYLVEAPAAISDTLAAAQSAGATNITVANAQQGWGASGCFQVDQEIECFTGSAGSGATTFAVARGQYGTLAQTHASGAAYASVGTGSLQTLCNGTTYSSVPVIFGTKWNWFTGALAAQNCNGSAMTIGSLTGANGPAGQTYKIAAIHIASQPALSSPTILGTATFTGNTTTFANGSAAEQDVVIQPGGGSDQTGALAWSNYAGTVQWKLKKDASNFFRLTDTVNSLDREVFYQNGQTILNAGAGANAVVVNGSSNSGSGGLLVQSGGSSPSTVLTVTGSGNTTANGFVSGKFMMGSGTISLSAGSAAGSSPTIACAAGHTCDGISGTVVLTTGASPTTGTLATFGFPNTHSNQANCVVSASSSTAQLTTVTWSESTTTLTLTAQSALAASTAYTIRYWCGGN